MKGWKRLGAVVGCLCFAAAAASAKETPVKIGVLADLSSVYSDISGQGSVEAARMAVKDFGGKVLGMPIEVISADEQLKPEIGVDIARNWYDKQGVDVITDVPSSAVALAVQTVSREKRKIVLFSNPGTSQLTGTSCSPYSAQWTYDTYALAHSTGSAILDHGGSTWFFITADYAFGHSLQSDTEAVIVRKGGKVLGSVNVPLGTADFGSALLKAQSSQAKVIGLAVAGGDLINVVKQASQFGIGKGGQKLAGLLVAITDVHSLGLQTAQGLLLTSAFYWNMNDQTRAWSERFYKRVGHMPTMYQAGVYSAVSHYLEAVKAIGSKDADRVMAEMRKEPINDFMTHNGKLRIDGRVLRDLYLFRVKSPAESKEDWDDYKLIATIPANDAFRPLDAGHCPLVANASGSSH